MTPILYHSDMSVCAAKVRILFAEKQVEWEGRLLNLRAGEAQTAEYVRINPAMLVPALIHGDAVIAESNVILEYIEDVWPTPPLRPTDAVAQARMRYWMRRVDVEVHPVIGLTSTAIAFRHQFLARKPEDLRQWLENIPDRQRRARAQVAIEQGMESEEFEGAVRDLARLFADLEKALEGQTWLAGESCSLAEVAFASYLLRFRHLGFEDMLHAHPHLKGWVDRVLARPAVKAGLVDWLNPAVLAIFERERPAAQQRIRSIAI